MPRPYYSAESLHAGNSIGYLIKRCGSIMAQIAEVAFEQEPLGFTQWVVLMSLDRLGSPVSATALSEELGHDMGALTRVVDGLERQGFVRRERGLQDRRTVEISLTEAGKRQGDRSKRVVVELLNTLTEPFSHTEVETLIGLLQRLLGRLQEHLEAGPEATPAAKAKKL
jgi:DNA-binding MarR family transcriptional regulator